MAIHIIIVLCSIALAAMRLYGIKDAAFQAAAHLFVGMLFGLLFRRDFRSFAFGCGAALSAVELVAAIRSAV